MNPDAGGNMENGRDSALYRQYNLHSNHRNGKYRQVSNIRGT